MSEETENPIPLISLHQEKNHCQKITSGAKAPQTTIPFPSSDQEQLNISTLETWLWDAACVIRGATDAPKFKDFILPLIFYKRLSDVFDDEFAKQVDEFGDETAAREIIDADHQDALKSGRNPIVRFFIPNRYRWESLRDHPADGRLGEFLTEAMREVARMNPQLQGVLDVEDFNERQSGQRTLDDDRLGGADRGDESASAWTSRRRAGYPGACLRISAQEICRRTGTERGRVLHAERGRVVNGTHH